MITAFPYAPILPELFLAASALVLLLYGVFRGEESGESVAWLSILALIVTAGLIIAQPSGIETLFNRALVIDTFGRFMKVLVLLGAALALIMSGDYLRTRNLLRFEYPILALLATLGMMLMISANDLITMYLSLELQSLALYVLAAFRRDAVRSSEAGLKYFVLGALSSGFLLYGASLLYGFTGATLFTTIASSLKGAELSLGATFGMVFVLTGVAFKISAVPFHMWTPDVYEGAPTPATALFAAAPKAAAFGLLTRALFAAFPTITGQWQQVIIALAVGSMLIGAFGAIGQSNFKRLMAYSSIGHVGYMLVGLAAGNEAGAQSMMIYLAIYLAMTLGAFACILAMRREEGMVESIDQLAGLSRNQPVMAFLLAMLMFSMAGIPPLAGFFAKFYVFLAAVKADLYWLAVLGVITSVIAAYYYVRIVKIMYFDEPAEKFFPIPAGSRFVLGVSGAFVLLFFLYPEPLIGAASAAARALF